MTTGPLIGSLREACENVIWRSHQLTLDEAACPGPDRQITGPSTSIATSGATAWNVAASSERSRHNRQPPTPDISRKIADAPVNPPRFAGTASPAWLPVR